MMVAKEPPPTISRPMQTVGGYSNFTSPQHTMHQGQMAGQGSFFYQSPYAGMDDFEPFLDGRTRIPTNPNPQFGIGTLRSEVGNFDLISRIHCYIE
jgi:hypothetical protein